MKFGNSIDLQGLQVKNSAGHVLATAPAAPTLGQRYYDTVLLRERFWNGTAWSSLADNALLLGGQNLAFVLDRANFTGTQIAATISDLASTVKAYKLSDFAAPTTAVPMNGQKITGLADPTLDTDAATQGYVKSQVSNAAAGIDSKPSVRVVMTGNDTLAGLAARDGVTLVAGDRVLATGQTTTTQNGVYVAASGGWTRALDADGAGEITPGATWFVEEGTLGTAQTWRAGGSGVITIGTTPILITQLTSASSYTASNGVVLNGSNFTAVVKAGGGLAVDPAGLSLDTTVVARKFSANIGDGSATSFTITHGLGTTDVVIGIKDAVGNNILADTQTISATQVTVTLGYVPSANALRVTIVG